MSPSSTRTDPRQNARMQCAGPDLNQMKTRFARLPGLTSGRQFCRSRTCSRQNMRGTGFEPADLYRTAPSTLRRWPSLATHARGVSLQPSVIRGAIKGLSFVGRPVGGPRFRASVPTVFPAEVVRARRPAAEQRAEVPKLRPKLESETRRPACVAERGDQLPHPARATALTAGGACTPARRVGLSRSKSACSAGPDASGNSIVGVLHSIPGGH